MCVFFFLVYVWKWIATLYKKFSFFLCLCKYNEIFFFGAYDWECGILTRYRFIYNLSDVWYFFFQFFFFIPQKIIFYVSDFYVLLGRFKCVNIFFFTIFLLFGRNSEINWQIVWCDKNCITFISTKQQIYLLENGIISRKK